MIVQKIILLVGCSAALIAADTFSITQDHQSLGPGNSAVFSAHSIAAGGPAPAVMWKVEPALGATLSYLGGANPSPQLTYTAPNPLVGACVQVKVTATGTGAASNESHRLFVALTAAPPADPQEPCPGAAITMSIIGFEQAGGSSTEGDQKFFFDLFRSSSLPFLDHSRWPRGDIFGPPWRWWGDVRIASYPQQVSTPVGQFASGFAQQVANLPVNELAQFGEFRTGLERRIGGFRRSFLPEPGAAQERTSLGFFFYYGALGSLSAPTAVAPVFNIPPADTPQRLAFDNSFPVSKYPVLGLSTTQYVAFTGSDRARVYGQYAGGFRLTTRFFDTAGSVLAAPAMVSASFGQNQMVTAGIWRGVVGTFEGFYPLPLGPRSKEVTTLFLFARANLRLGGGHLTSTPLALSPATTGSPAMAVPITNPNVAIIAVPSNRDLYSIGAGIDVVQLIRAIPNPTNPSK